RRVERVLERTIQSTATAAAASREIQVTGQEIQSIGSTYEPSTITSKWRWQPVEDPVVPAMATVSPSLTVCPARTTFRVLWLYVVAMLAPLDLPCDSTTRLP